jgi:NADH:ubiquinone oxidoreductase subunit E
MMTKGHWVTGANMPDNIFNWADGSLTQYLQIEGKQAKYHIRYCNKLECFKSGKHFVLSQILSRKKDITH